MFFSCLEKYITASVGNQISKDICFVTVTCTYLHIRCNKIGSCNTLRKCGFISSAEFEGLRNGSNCRHNLIFRLSDDRNHIT